MQGTRTAMCAAAVLMALASCRAGAQTADPAVAPVATPLTVPPARSGTYTVQNGELVVAPGLRIPNGNVPWALDTVDGKQVLVPIHHSTLTAGSALEGAASHTTLRAAAPVFFLHGADRTENVGDAGRGAPTGWALSAARAEGGGRVLARVRFAEVNAATVCDASVVCMLAESLPGGWLRLSPKAPLEPGEYALMPVPRTANSAVPIVYDFSIGTGAPPSPDTVAPGSESTTGKGKKKR